MKNNNNNKNILKSSSFTLIELIIVLAIISILVTILIATIKPTEIFKKTRDSKRIADLKNIEKTIDLLYSTYPNFNELNYASTNIVYISLKDNSPTCSSYISDLPSLPSGYQYRCSANPQNIDGTGWIPIPFKNFDILNISQLFIDPINKPPYYYSFVVGGSYEVTAALEADSNKGPDAIGGKDGGDHNFVYEAGTNKKLTPSSIQARAEPDSLKQGLVLWLTFDEGTGTTTKDLSGNGNNGVLQAGSFSWVESDKCISKCIRFEATYPTITVQVPASTLWDTPQITFIYLQKSTNALTRNASVRAGPYWSTGFWGVRWATAGEGGCGGGGIITYAGASSQFFCTSLSNNTMYQTAVIWDDSNKTVKAYVNGSRISTQNYSPQSIVRGAAKGLIIFTEVTTGNIIDEVRIYSRALSDSEIKSLYEATK